MSDAIENPPIAEQAFDLWFTSRHGDRPGMGYKAEKDLHVMALAGKQAEEMLALMKRWDDMRGAALEAWLDAKRHRRRKAE